MNRALPPRDRGNRVADYRRAFRLAGIMSGTLRLVRGIADSRERKTRGSGQMPADVRR